MADTQFARRPLKRIHSTSPLTSRPSSRSGSEELNEIDAYEKERLENIRQRDALLASLGFTPTSNHPPPPKPAKQPKSNKDVSGTRASTRSVISIGPTRRSARVAGLVSKAEYDDLASRSPSPRKPLFAPLPKGRTPQIPAPAVKYSDSSTGPSSPASRPTRSSSGVLQFEGRWSGVFTPNVTPEEMFAGGAFGGSFFIDTYSNVLKTPISSSTDIPSLPFSIPESKKSTYLANPVPDPEVNRFKVRAGQSLQEWEKAGWIWPGDPRGWAQWYVRFWQGRRCEDDERQIRRWLKVAGPTGRFKRALLKKVHQAGGKGAQGLRDENVGRVLRQCLWQWGYELNEHEYDEAMSNGGG
ncbi:hypothetical protein BCR39DRAFT_512657 [Naematelia encephala]|uniref:Uncharacterized protein n=1 Tax=Naematelia encephala TaxID=71784 RepID=A0A1Y2BM83_9TREE|nr:hypothetical protein BCR39DRAFT_512657 [Naematelia encephala]